MARPHVIIFPLPLQGPVNCMLKLAELLCLQHIHVTFINTEHIQRRLQSCSDVQSLSERYTNFRIETIPDGLPEDDPRTGDRIVAIVQSMEDVSQPILRQMLTSGSLGPSSENPASCVIADGVFSFAVEMAKQSKLPLVYFDTISPCGLWAYLCLPKLIEAGEFPFRDDDLDVPIKHVEEMECVMRRRDFPSFYQIREVGDALIQLILKEDRELPKAQALIFNTFENLDSATLSLMRTLGPEVYAVGPIHTHLNSRLAAVGDGGNRRAAPFYGLWREDRACIAWLDAQPPKSVVYVSIGSLASMTVDQSSEIWHGLVNSGARFLWVRREGSIVGAAREDHSAELLGATEERGLIVKWAPQEEVLSHPGVGGFLTHGGWNSTLESVAAGVPMIGWPYFVDQQVNTRYLSEVWNLGLDMKDVCDRRTVEKMVREVMDVRKDEFLGRADDMAKLAELSIEPGGSSYTDLDRLIQDIKFNGFKI